MIFRRRSQTQPSAEAFACDLISKSDLFDAIWYLEKYPDVRQAGFDPVLHYVRHGAKEGRQPGPWFDTGRYLSALEGMVIPDNPLLHYLENRQSVVLKDPQPKREYSNFREFLNFAMLNPLTKFPFKEEDRRCFSVMEAVANYLVQGLRGDEAVKVSIIMPVRNRAQTLRTAIESVVAQRYKNFELIVVDDGSDDESILIAKTAALTDTRIRLIELGNASGVCVARNVGLVNSTGSLIAYLDSDNTWLEDYLGATVGAFQALPEADAIYSGQFVYADNDLNKLSAVRFAPMNISLLQQHNYIDLNCFAHRRKVLDTPIRFDENLQRLVDWDFILKISNSFRIFSVPVLLSNYYLHAAENTISKTVAIEPAIRTINSRTNKASHISGVGKLTKPVCAVIPSYQALSFLCDCVESLVPYLQDELFELVIVDNNSSDEVKEYLRKIESKKIKIIFNDTNYGFSYAVNQGVAAGSPEADIILINNDARLEADSLNRLQETAYESSDIAISVPRQILPAGSRDIALHVPYATLSTACDVSLSCYHKNIDSTALFHDGRRVELSFAPFFCVYIKRAIWEACCGLDHENGRHYRSDRIMCDFVKQVLKLRIVYTPEARVHHAAQVATNALTRSNRGDSDYHLMLVKNIWPAELMEDLNIASRPWLSD